MPACWGGRLFPMRFLSLPLLLLPALLALPLHAQFPGTNWERLSDDEAAAAGWSRADLAQAQTFSRTLATEAVMIVTQGKILDSWGPIERKFNVHSIRKSFISAMIGIRAGEGRIRLDATMAELGIDDRSPRLSATEKQATVRHLLQARSGVYHPALYETAAMKARRPARHSHAPGTHWYYNNWDFNTLCTIYEKAAGVGFYDDLKHLIGDPIGMEDYRPSDGEYVTGDASIHPAYPFHMSTRDLARFGLLFLRGGKWNEVQVVPEAWVRDSVTTWSDSERSGGGYGYLWWTEVDGRHLPGVRLPAGSYSARGAGGHYVLVIPSLDLIIVHRVNTDVRGRRVGASQFAELVRLILGDRAVAVVETEDPLE